MVRIRFTLQLLIVIMKRGSTVDDVMMFVVDEVIGQVISIMKTQSVPYTAMFTALQPSRVRCLHKAVCTYTLTIKVCQACGLYHKNQKEITNER